MTEKEAYGNRTYSQRINTWYKAGDKVTIGPAYRMGGEYISDGAGGNYVVVSKVDSMGDYKVARGDVVSDYDDWDFIVHASRLTRR